ncbi:MAG: DEAD/DEAH box helicase, partial [Candidatus Eisenbacteria bacterium]|nr:DEAD/DEAH box helicase [Candidatus Eisenbacteria bacterium]
MHPITMAEEIKAGYQSYIRTTFPVADESLRSDIHTRVDEEGMLWRGPLLSLQRPYVRDAQTLAEQSDDLSLHSDLLTAGATPIGDKPQAPFGQWKLFSHQREAIAQITAGHNTVVSSGTGSGKTEAFFLPVLDYCLRHRGPGIKALILYPMNALANDQYERFARYLAGTGVTFGRYTGDTPEDEERAIKDNKEVRPEGLCREAIWYRKEMRRAETLPNILMTNYAMLEFLLLRKEDRRLFDEGLRFLILDEIHTYAGARGVEVACLIRRLREHIGKLEGELVCIGTSATVRGRETEAVARFAGELFADTFDSDHIVMERYEDPDEPEDPYLPPEAAIEPGELEGLHNLEDAERIEAFCAKHLGGEAAIERARWEAQQELPKLPKEKQDPIAELLGALLSRNALFRAIERILGEPCSLDEVTRYLATGERPERMDSPQADNGKPLRPGANEAYLRREVEAYLLLGTRALLGGDPLIRPKVHMFWRGLQGFWRCT